jgi:hypothetical protein
LDRLESATIADLADLYVEARRELLGIIQERRDAVAATWRVGDDDRALSRALARDYTLYEQIDQRLGVLRDAAGSTIEDQQGRVVDHAQDLGREQLDVVAQGLNLAIVFNMALINFDAVEIGLEEALASLAQDQVALAQTLKSGLRLGLLQGEKFEDLVKRLLAQDASVFSRGATSAELAARRTVITAENASRDLIYDAYAEDVPGLQKQAIAEIAGNTTDCCLRVHGQIRDLDKPYDLTGTPRFSDAMMYPAFHWNCRTSSAPYHAEFERGSSLTTPTMVSRAQAEIARRTA